MSELTPFPKSKVSALAMLYVQKHATSDHSPEELLDLYEDAYKRIDTHSRELHKARLSSR